MTTRRRLLLSSLLVQRIQAKHDRQGQDKESQVHPKVREVVLPGLGAQRDSERKQLQTPTLIVAAIALGFMIGIVLIQRPELLHGLLNRLAGLPLVGGGIVHARAFLDAAHTLFNPRLLACFFQVEDQLHRMYDKED